MTDRVKGVPRARKKPVEPVTAGTLTPEMARINLQKSMGSDFGTDGMQHKADEKYVVDINKAETVTPAKAGPASVTAVAWGGVVPSNDGAGGGNGGDAVMIITSGGAPGEPSKQFSVNIPSGMKTVSVMCTPPRARTWWELLRS